MKLRSFLVAAFFFCSSLCIATAAEIAGTWTAQFDSQIGVQTYVYVFTEDGDKLTGKASYDHSMGKGESQLKDIKLENDMISFVETVRFDGMELVIIYSGKVTADQMDLKRVVGDFATEQIVVKRAKPQTAKSAK